MNGCWAAPARRVTCGHSVHKNFSKLFFIPLPAHPHPTTSPRLQAVDGLRRELAPLIHGRAGGQAGARPALMDTQCPWDRRCGGTPPLLLPGRKRSPQHHRDLHPETQPTEAMADQQPTGKQPIQTRMLTRPHASPPRTATGTQGGTGPALPPPPPNSESSRAQDTAKPTRAHNAPEGAQV